MKTRYLLFVPLVGLGAFSACSSSSGSGLTNADKAYYTMLVNNLGIETMVKASPHKWVSVGAEVCSLPHSTDTAGLNADIATDTDDVVPADEASYLYTAAVTNLCPPA
jgi:Protein of unknown function (DUF732)